MNSSAKPSDTWELATRQLGRRTLVFDRLESTNGYAALLADDLANDGLVVVAREQTAGRGQHGRTWQAPAGSSVLLSALLFPPPALRRPALLTAWAAVSVCNVIRDLTDLNGQIKWPNDVLIAGRKVCGILIEQAAGTVVGVGLNLNQRADQFAVAGLEQAGSLAFFGDDEFDCDDAARLLIQQLDDQYERLCRGEVRELETSWKQRLGLLGKQVVAVCADGEKHGRLSDLSFDGVELETLTGAVRLLPELVRRLRPE
jgi:BirA family biotin operon repressor/biotin-[acetyl-CoA-carboxylase] ligase